MVRYLVLIQLTDSGVRAINDSASRALAFGEEVKAAGGQVTAQYWAVGQFDGVVVFEVPDDAIAASLLLNLAREGFARTQSLRLFDTKEFNKLIRE